MHFCQNELFVIMALFPSIGYILLHFKIWICEKKWKEKRGNVLGAK